MRLLRKIRLEASQPDSGREAVNLDPLKAPSSPFHYQPPVKKCPFEPRASSLPQSLNLTRIVKLLAQVEKRLLLEYASPCL